MNTEGWMNCTLFYTHDWRVLKQPVCTRVRNNLLCTSDCETFFWIMTVVRLGWARKSWYLISLWSDAFIESCSLKRQINIVIRKYSVLCSLVWFSTWFNKRLVDDGTWQNIMWTVHLETKMASEICQKRGKDYFQFQSSNIFNHHF